MLSVGSLLSSTGKNMTVRGNLFNSVVKKADVQLVSYYTLGKIKTSENVEAYLGNFESNLLKTL